MIPKIIIHLRRSDTLQNFREIGGLNYEKMSSLQQQVTNIEKKINQIKKKNDKMIKYLLFKKKKNKEKKTLFSTNVMFLTHTYAERKMLMRNYFRILIAIIQTLN